MAELNLSEQLRQVRSQQRREKLAPWLDAATTAGDIFTGGAIGRARRRKESAQDKPLTLREKIATARSQAKLQSQEKLNNRRAQQQGEISDKAQKKLEALRASRQRKLAGKTEEGVRNKWATWMAKERGKWTDVFVGEFLEDLAKLDPTQARLIMQMVDPTLLEQLNKNEFPALGKDKRGIYDKINRAELADANLELQIQEQERIAEQADAKLAEIESSRAVGAGGNAAGIYDAAAHVRELMEVVPDSRKKSVQQISSLMKDEQLIEMAENMGVDAENDTQMRHFVKTVIKAQKRADKILKLAAKNGWTADELADRYWEKPTPEDYEGMMTDEQQLNRAKWILMGIDDPAYLAAKDQLVAGEFEEVMSFNADEYTPSMDLDPDTEGIQEPQRLIDARKAREAEEVPEGEVSEESLQVSGEVGVDPDALSDEEFLERYGMTREEAEDSDKGFTEAQERSQLREIEQGQLEETDADVTAMMAEEEFAPAVEHGHANWTPERIAARDAYIKAQESGRKAEALIAANEVRRLDGKPLIPQAKIDAAAAQDAKRQNQAQLRETDDAVTDMIEAEEFKPLSFTAPRVRALQKSLTREQEMAEALADAPESPPKTPEQLEQERKAKNTTVAGAAAALQ